MSTSVDDTLFFPCFRPSPSTISETSLRPYVLALSVEHIKLSVPIMEIGGNSNRRVTEIAGATFVRVRVGIIWNQGPVIDLLFKSVSVHGDFACIVQISSSRERRAGDETTVYLGRPSVSQSCLVCYYCQDYPCAFARGEEHSQVLLSS